MAKLSITFCMALLSFLSFGQSKLTVEQLQANIAAELQQQKGTFAVAFKDLSTGKSFQVNGNDNFHAASTMKTPVMIELYRQADKKKFRLSDSIVIKNEFKSIVDGSPFSLNAGDDSEPYFYKHIGEKTTLDTLLYKMIIASSNLATNMLIELVDAKNVTATMRSFGANDIQVLRGVEDQKAYDKGLNNTTTANDLAIIFEKIAKGKAASKKSCKAMIKTLLDQQFNSIIPAQLPKDVKVAHKTGSITRIHHDSGIVILPDGKMYVLVLLSKNFDNEKDAIQAMANVSKEVYDFVTGH